MNSANGFVGVMDSGVGGVSVLKALKAILPYESYIYLSDSINAPYGVRAADDIRRAVLDNAQLLLRMGAKALVIACNTATAVAVEALRSSYPTVYIVGVEPAVRPALEYAIKNSGDVLVLTTNATVHEPRFYSLCERCCAELGGMFVNDEKNNFRLLNSKEGNSCPRVYPLSIQKTVTYVEHGKGESEINTDYLREMLAPLAEHRFSAVVEGCTHFPFAEKSIVKALGYEPRFFDGALGAAKRLRFLLEKNRLIGSHTCGWGEWIEWLDTGGSIERIKCARGLFRSSHSPADTK